MRPTTVITCPICRQDFVRTVQQVKAVCKKSSIWRCRPCVVKQRNKASSSPIGEVRIHKKSGYLEEKTEYGWRRQHIVVMERHLGRRLIGGEVVHHINEIKTDNRLINLRLMDATEHMLLHHIGAKRSQETRARIRDACRRRSTTKMSWEYAIEVRRAMASGAVSQRELSARFGVSPMTISRIVNNQTWN